MYVVEIYIPAPEFEVLSQIWRYKLYTTRSDEFVERYVFKLLKPAFQSGHHVWFYGWELRQRDPTDSDQFGNAPLGVGQLVQGLQAFSMDANS